MKLEARTLGGGVVALAVFAGVLWVWPKESRTPEDEVLEMAGEMMAAAERREVGGILEHIAEGFQSAEGLDKDQLRGLLTAQMFRGGGIAVLPLSQHVELRGEGLATLKGTYVFSRGAAPGGDGGLGRYEIDAEVSREAGGDWRVVKASYRRQ